VFPWKGGARQGMRRLLWINILCFSCFGLLSCTLKWGDIVPTKLQKFNFKKRSEKTHASLFDNFEQCVLHTHNRGRPTTLVLKPIPIGTYWTVLLASKDPSSSSGDIHPTDHRYCLVLRVVLIV
jgi:hypothetical protein